MSKLHFISIESDAWIWLFFAGFCEVMWVLLLKQSSGFSKPLISALVLIFSLSSLLALSKALNEIPIGTGYAIWTGIGILGAFILGVLFYGEALTLSRTLYAGLILLGIIGLKFSTTN